MDLIDRTAFTVDTKRVVDDKEAAPLGETHLDAVRGLI